MSKHAAGHPLGASGRVSADPTTRPPALSALGIRGRKNLPAPRALPFALLSPFFFFFLLAVFLLP